MTGWRQTVTKPIRTVLAATAGLLVLLMVLATHAVADEADWVIANLPTDFHGTFQWDNDPTVQEVKVRIDSVAIGSDRQVTATGSSVYTTHGQKTAINVTWLIDPATGRFEMWEEDPTSADFVTDGSHVGTISADLKSINAMWTTRSSGQLGQLCLYSKGSKPRREQCSAESARRTISANPVF